jgi:hypothetical protein
MSNNRLHDQPGERGGDPEDGNVINPGTQGLENPGNIRVLQSKPELYAQESKAHVPNLPETQVWLTGRNGTGGHCGT